MSSIAIAAPQQPVTFLARMLPGLFRLRAYQPAWLRRDLNAFLPSCARLTTHGWHRSLLRMQMRIRIHVPKLYEPPGTREAAEANARAANGLEQARKAGTLSGQYLANTVLFAAVLFFANASSRFEQRRVRVVAFSFAIAVFLFAVVRTAMLPI